MNYFEKTIFPKFPTDRENIRTTYPTQIIYAVPSYHIGYTKLKTRNQFSLLISRYSGYDPRF